MNVSTRVHVDPDRVWHAGTSLARASGPVGDAAREIDAVLRRLGADSGSERLGAAGARSARQWGCGLSELADAVDLLGQATIEAAQAYRIAEASARDSFGPLGSLPQ